VATVSGFVDHLLSGLHCEDESVCVCVCVCVSGTGGGRGITPSVEWETGTTPLASSCAQARCSPATFRLGVVQV
jgi:hypothetical protein